MSNEASLATEALLMDPACRNENWFHLRGGGCSVISNKQSVREILSIRTLVTWTAPSTVPPEFCLVRDEAQALNTAASGTCISSSKPSPCCSWGLNQFSGSLSLLDLWYLSIILDLFAESLHSQVSSIRSGSRLKAEGVSMIKLEAN